MIWGSRAWRELTGFTAWWMRRTYYLFQMPRWDTRVRIALDWTVSRFFWPDLTKVDLARERELERRNCPAGGSPSCASTPFLSELETATVRRQENLRLTQVPITRTGMLIRKPAASVWTDGAPHAMKPRACLKAGTPANASGSSR